MIYCKSERYNCIIWKELLKRKRLHTVNWKLKYIHFRNEQCCGWYIGCIFIELLAFVLQNEKRQAKRKLLIQNETSPRPRYCNVISQLFLYTFTLLFLFIGLSYFYWSLLVWFSHIFYDRGNHGFNLIIWFLRCYDVSSPKYKRKKQQQPFRLRHRKKTKSYLNNLSCAAAFGLV